jgi:hypothetical protein
MKQYAITYEKNGLYHGILVNANDPDTARAFFLDHKPGATICGEVTPATADDQRPGKPCITAPEDFTVKTPAEPEKMPTEPESPATVQTLDLLDNLDTGDHGDRLNDYRDDDSYICDIISEIADADTSIYYADILEFIRKNPESLSDVIAEGLYNPGKNYDLYQHAQAAEFMTIERDIYDHLADSIMAAAVNFIRYDLKRETIPAELAELLREWCDDADNNDRMNEIPDRIREYFEEIDAAPFENFCAAHNCDACPFKDCKTLDECREHFEKEARQ